MIKAFKVVSILTSTFGFRLKHLSLLFFRSLIFSFTSLFLLIDKMLFRTAESHRLKTPLFMIGHYRSGTTFVHRFITDNCKDIKGLYLWEMIFPSLSTRFVMKYFTPLMKKFSLDNIYDPKIHKTGLLTTESDDIALFLRYFDGMLSWLYFYCWKEYKSESELETELLKVVKNGTLLNYIESLHRKNVYNIEERMFSKSFWGLFMVDQIKKQFPDAKIMLILRDPLEAIPSIMSLQRSVQNRMNNLESQSEELKKRYYSNIYKTSEIYYRKFHEIASNSDGYFMTVTYKNLMQNFEGSFNEIADFYKLQKTEKLKQTVKLQAETQRAYKTDHKYSLEEFGLSEKMIRKDFDFIYENYDI